MTIIETLFLTFALIVTGLFVVGVFAVWQDHRVRRDWDLADERAAWRAKVDAMRRIHDAEIEAYRDDRGDA